MRLAADASRIDRPGGRLFRLGLLLGVAWLPAGCASLSPGESGSGGRLGSFWKRGGHNADPNGYDLYADTLASNRRRPAGGPEALARVPRPTAGEPAADDRLAANLDEPERPAPGELPEPAEPARAPSGRPDGRSVRVTLGRPESLPTVPSRSASPAPALAAAPNHGWRRRGEAPIPPLRSMPVEAEADAAATEARPAEVVGARPARPATAPPPAEPEPQPGPSLPDILAKARKNLDAMETYQVKITRVERVGGRLQPEEDVVLSIRRSPKAVRLQWEKGPSKGREVLFSEALNSRMMYVHLGNPALPIPRMTIPVDSPLVLRNSRHAITEAGFETIFDNLSDQLKPGGPAGPAGGALVYKGTVKPEGLAATCHLVERVTPQGETWKVYLDTERLMPAMVSAFQPDGGLIERYVYRDLRENPVDLAAAEAFDPDKRWGESKGLFSRLARAASAPPSAPPRTTR